MKTKDHVNKWRENHHKALETLRGPDCHLSGLQLWRKLRAIERNAHDAATKYCNTEIDELNFDAAKDRASEQVSILFGRKVPGFFVNSDPRGHALKLDNEKVEIPEGMHKDWGGYGILAAEIN